MAFKSTMRSMSAIDNSRSITCPKCGRTSHHIKDVFYRYCGNCHAFHDDMKLFVRPLKMNPFGHIEGCACDDCRAAHKEGVWA